MTDLVVLAPGFLGFDHFGGFPYFAQTTATALRVALEDICRDRALDLRVVPCATIPAGSLEERQETLLRHLNRCLDWAEAKSGKPAHLHVVGHSTGGLDAELLALRRPLGHEYWKPTAERVRRALRSLISLAAPLAGTSLAEAPLVQLLATSEVRSVRDVLSWPLQQLERVAMLPGALPDLWPGLIEGIPPLLKDDAAKLLAGSALYDPHAVVELVNSLRTNRKLLQDLRPGSFQAIADIGPDARLDRIQRARYLTVARSAPARSDAGKLFEYFSGLTARYAEPAPLAGVQRALAQRVAQGSIPIIGASRELPPLDAAASDGIVNTLRQLPLVAPAALEHELERVAAIVIADHLDVLGYFPTETPFAEESPNGFLSSGSNFRDREFCALWRSIALQISKSIP